MKTRTWDFINKALLIFFGTTAASSIIIFLALGFVGAITWLESLVSIAIIIVIIAIVAFGNKKPSV